MSRLGSRLLPENVVRGLLSSGEETEAEGRALRHGAERIPTAYERQSPATSLRHSIRESIRHRAQRSDTRRRHIRGPFPLGHTEHQVLHEQPLSDVSHERAPTQYEIETPSSRRMARLGRFRQSLVNPIQSIFNRENESSQDALTSRHNVRREAGNIAAEDATQLLPPIVGLDHRLDLDESPHELDAVEPETRNLLSSSRITQGMSTIRRFPHGLRSRSTRLIRRGEHPPLSQVLQLAAAAIAAQLSGHANPSVGNARPLTADAFDGSIQNFVQTLQDAASAQAGENIDLNAADGDLPPVNFMRVFQFPNDENGAPITGQGQAHNPELMEVENMAANMESDRSVTLVLVGVRSMPHSHESNNENGTIGPSLDTLLSLPFLPPTNVLRNGSSGALFRRSDGRQRSAARRHSMTNFNFPAQYESQRHQRTQRSSTSPTQGVQTAETSLRPPLSSISSESPPGPHPPPSTPADMRSGTVTPIRRPSSASAVNSPPLPNLDEQDISAARSRPPITFNNVRQRRRSDSEFARRPELSSGASRRHGVVEPDAPPMGMGRSWLIYVVGTNVSSDHPAFTMPSLFTDNPSYEDMQMLSTLLGPVKPPVATEEDIVSAGGTYRVALIGNELVAEPTTQDIGEPIMIENGNRCLICLCDYEASEELRQLTKCRHIYHRECVDEVRRVPENIPCRLC